MMLLRLDSDRSPDCVDERLPVQAAQIHFVRRMEAGLELPVGGDADAVARRTEMLADGADEPDGADAARQAVELCNAGGADFK